MIKLLYTNPLPLNIFHCFLKVFLPIPYLTSIQLPIFIEKSHLSCDLHHRQKKTEKAKNYN